MYINEKILEHGRGGDSLFAFFHAQRTGGSAFLRWLSQTFPNEKIFSRPTLGPSYAHWHKIDAARLDGYRVFGGFSQYRDKTDLSRPLVCFSLARHPFYRIVSVYQMSRRDKLHYRHEQAMSLSFEDYYRAVDEDEPSYLRNLICSRICNTPNADAAIETMARRYGAVSTTARLRDMTELLARTYGWSAPPVRPVVTDEERYAAYEGSTIFDDVMEKSAEDVKLYDFVRAYEQRRAAEAVAPAPEPSPIVVSTGETTAPAHTCTVCRAPFETAGEKGECPSCKSPARTRSLPAVLAQVVAPQLAKTGNAHLPLLVFAATGWERKLLTPHFPHIRSVSLYGKYAGDNTIGVDVRDLSRYPDASFSGAFGILLFDYFPEHEKALTELSRVIAPGGILFTLILPARVRPDLSAPTVTREIKPRPGYFDYIPEGGVLLNVIVGQDWLLNAMAKTGFAPLQLRVPDAATAEVSQWFIGIKQDKAALPRVADAPLPPPAQPVTPMAEASAAVAKPPAKPSVARARVAVPPHRITAPALTSQTRMTEPFSQEFSCPLEGFDGLKSICVRLTIPSVPVAGRRTDFAEHRWLIGENRSTTDITCVGADQIMVSNDLGKSWDISEPSELAGKRLMNHFTTAAGSRLIQLAGWSEDSDSSEECGAIYRLSADGAVTGRTQNSGARWHGPRAIGEQQGVILYSDYFDNAGLSTLKPGTPEWNERVHTNHVWRSDDDGQSWRSVFSRPPTEIRHFHFVMSDPYAPGTWWLSSGDKPRACRCWRSDDNGETWLEVSHAKPDVTFHPLAERSRQAVFRATDMVILPDRLIWGTDDVLIFNDEFKVLQADPQRQNGYPAIGSRLFMAAKSDKLQPVEIGMGGHPFRNFVDVGPGYIVWTEAKYAPIGFEPVVYFVGKAEPHRVQRLFTVPNTRGKGSGFTYSRASRAAVDGRFFSFRGAGDLSDILPRLLQWDVAFA